MINWDSIATDSRDFLVMGDPFDTYEDEVARFLKLAEARAQKTPTPDGL